MLQAGNRALSMHDDGRRRGVMMVRKKKRQRGKQTGAQVLPSVIVRLSSVVLQHSSSVEVGIESSHGPRSDGRNTD